MPPPRAGASTRLEAGRGTLDGVVSAITLSSVIRRVEGTRILDDVSLHVRDGELLVLIGPSGSGKTSLIRVIAGLDEISSGDVLFDDEVFTHVKVAERDVGLVFQSHALFPRHTARENVGFPLRVRSMSRSDMHKRVVAEARALGIEHILDRWPNQLSAGHQQLVQIARSMVRVPRVLLLDEPMANVDQPTRKRLRQDLRELQRGYGVTTVYATNDPVEAMFMADRIAALDSGRLRQVGTPGELYARPANTHIAWLTGAISLLPVAVERDSSGYWLGADGLRIRSWAEALAAHVGGRVQLGVRPEGVRLLESSPLRATVAGLSFESGTTVTRVTVGRSELTVPQLSAELGTEVGISIDRYLLFTLGGELVAAVE